MRLERGGAFSPSHALRSLHVRTATASSAGKTARQMNAEASTCPAERRTSSGEWPRYPASARMFRRGSSGNRRRATSCRQATSRGKGPSPHRPCRSSRNPSSNRAKWITHGAGRPGLALTSRSIRDQACCGATASARQPSFQPVSSRTGREIRVPSGGAIQHRSIGACPRGPVIVHPISRSAPCFGVAPEA